MDISNMGQVRVQGEEAKKFLETLIVADLDRLQVGQCAYTLVMNDYGGVKDECIITREAE